MTPERWEQISSLIEKNFSIDKRYQEDLAPGTSDVIEFSAPPGKLKACFITKPKVLDKKTIYTQRAGSEVRTEYSYSPTETVCYLQLFRWEEDTESWQELSGDNLSDLVTQ